MLVRDAMNKNVISSDVGTSLREAAKIMTDNHVGCLIARKNNDVVGIITDRDILLRLAEGEKDFDSTLVGNAMTCYVIYARPDMSLENAVKLMQDNKIKKLPVLENEKLVGIITTTNIALAEPDKTSMILTIGSRKH